MTRVLAYVLRFCRNIKSKNDKNKNNYLSSAELNNALRLILKHDQSLHFKGEFHSIGNGTCLKGSLKPLHPFVDEEGLLRVGGRLDHANLTYVRKHPLILAKNSHVTQLIILNEHYRLLHAGPKLLLSSLNERYWIINGIREIKKVTHKCIMCFRLKAAAAKQLMGSLPADRVTPSRPFEKVGIDFAGPVNVKLSRIRKSVVGKGYICVFVCFSTKAIHLELASDLTTDTFLACFKRLISRRGLPTDVYCDNAATFKGADNQLADLHKLLASRDHQTQVQDYSATRGVRFNFIPCYSPVFGGLWEAAVKSTKYHLKRIVHNTLLTYEQLQTVLCEIEAVLNSRPLVPMSTSDIDDFSYLTPGHFLIGVAPTSYPEQNVSDVPNNRLRFWDHCIKLKQMFWKVWYKHYLTVLQTRPKWRDDVPNIDVGSLVILREQDTPPLSWPMARVTKVFPGADQKVRALEVKTPNGKTHIRSVTKVSVLPIDK
ncbi:uncharacterized protein LOC126378112 [Pectinophora gossypiella]|nr:uncharacterized protein LOC126378112 [Pectinophora gossypiella]